MNRSVPLSVILIVKNESRHLAECLAAVSWAQEIIVIDSGSTDDTVHIAKQWATRVEVMDWPGFGRQKNRALDLATCEWVLSIDADERVTPELAAEIRRFLQSPQSAQVVACTLPRLSSYCGRPMKHSGWWPDPVARLFRRQSCRFSDDRVHERLLTQGPLIALTQLLLHESFHSLEQVLDKVNHYSSEGALKLWEKGRQASVGTAIAHGAWAFFRTYLLKKGFLDGREGFLVSVSNAEGTYYRYLKLMFLNEKSNHPK